MEKLLVLRRHRRKFSKFLIFPLIDVLFLVSTFFIFVALAPIRAVPVTHHTGAAPHGPNYFADKVLVIIDNPINGNELGQMHLHARSISYYRNISYDEMSSHLQNLQPKQKQILLINVDRDVFHEQVIRVLDIAQAVGIRKLGFSDVEVVNVQPRFKNRYR